MMSVRTICGVGASVLLGLGLAFPAGAWADPPVAAYIFPAGGQRGTTVSVRVGGLYLHDGCPWSLRGAGVTASPRLTPTETVWFEGPVLPLPDSQRAEDYPKDYLGEVKIAPTAPFGPRLWQLTTSQGVTGSRPFIIGDLPEILEREIDGLAVAVPVALPLTINGRIFPREDTDLYTFTATKGDIVTLHAATRSLGSPFDARLEVRDAAQRRLVESRFDHRGDAVASFQASADGTYSCLIHDIAHGGLQTHVYRLTITHGPYVEAVFPAGAPFGKPARFELLGYNVPDGAVTVALPAAEGTEVLVTATTPRGTSQPFPVLVDTDPAQLETEPNDTAAEARSLSLPGIAYGRVGQPGDTDVWTLALGKGQLVEFDLRAQRIGSPLDVVLTIRDEKGSMLQKLDDTPDVAPDVKTLFTAPSDGTYSLTVADRSPQRGGARHAYRLQTRTLSAPGFTLTLLPDRNQPGADGLSLERGGSMKLKVRAQRAGGFTGEIQLTLDPLPPGVTLSGSTIGPKAQETTLTLQAAADAPLAATRVRLVGTSRMGETDLKQSASVEVPSAGGVVVDEVLLGVAMPTPFKVRGIFETKYSQRGASFTRRYEIDRNGFTGPLEIRLADRQARHLQGVTGESIVVPADRSEFDYTIFLPPWMEIGRTSRTCVMAVGTVREPDGTEHRVSFTSLNQNEQMVILVDPGQLSIDVDRTTLRCEPGATLELAVKVGRGAGLQGEATVELVLPRHVRGVTVPAIVIPVGEERGRLVLRCDREALGPFNMPFVVRATLKQQGRPVTAETEVELVAPATK